MTLKWFYSKGEQVSGCSLQMEVSRPVSSQMETNISEEMEPLSPAAATQCWGGLSF